MTRSRFNELVDIFCSYNFLEELAEEISRNTKNDAMRHGLNSYLRDTAIGKNAYAYNLVREAIKHQLIMNAEFTEE